MHQLPSSARKAAEIVDLPSFLEGVSVGFHWDILDRMESGVYFVDRNRRIMYWSDSAEKITGYDAEEVLGSCCKDNILKHVDGSGHCLCEHDCPLNSSMTTGECQNADVYLHHRNGHRVPVRVCAIPVWNEDGSIIGAIETFSETTALLAPLERVKQLEEVAFIDALTGIANRRMLDHELGQRLTDYRERGWGLSVILIDVDRFKLFNDVYGHHAGDEVLKTVAQTLLHTCEAHDLVGRWGGEEFLIISSRADEAGTVTLAERARHLVAASSIAMGAEELWVTISAGCAVARAGESAEMLLSRADRCLYAAKNSGRNCVKSSADDLEAVQHLSL